MRIFRLLCGLLLFLTFEARSGFNLPDIPFFHVATSGHNISLLKVAVPRLDFVADGRSVEYLVKAHDLQGNRLFGEMTVTLDSNHLFQYIRGRDLLQNFPVNEGQFVALSLSELHERRPGSVAFNPIVTHMMYDYVEDFSNLRLMHKDFQAATGCVRNEVNFGFFNRGSNTQNQSYLLLVNRSLENAQEISVSFGRQQDNNPVGIVRLSPNESIMLSAKSLEDGKDPHVLKTIVPAEGNRHLYLDGIRHVKAPGCATWIKNDQSFESLTTIAAAQLDQKGDVTFYLADRDPKNQPVLNLINFNFFLSNFGSDSIQVIAFDENGIQVTGQATITPPDSAFEADKLLVFDHDLRYGNEAKGIVSSFGDNLTGIVTLSFRHLGICMINVDCYPTIQYLLIDKSGAVRDFSSFFIILRNGDVSMQAFFNRGENVRQESFLLLYNPEPISVQVAISDLHQDLVDSVAIVDIPPHGTKLLSSSMLEKGSDVVGGGLLPSQDNRQLQVAPLIGDRIVVMNLIKDENGVWRNLSLRRPFASTLNYEIVN